MLKNIDWDTYFISVAFLSAKRSKDPTCKVGAVIINNNNIIVATGYNGFPKKINDDFLSWDKNNINPLKNKYPYVIHAEINAILNRNQTDLTNCTLYTTHYPCNECTKMILQSNITTIKYFNKKKDEASEIMINLSGIKCEQINLNIDKILIKFE